MSQERFPYGGKQILEYLPRSAQLSAVKLIKYLWPAGP